MHFQVVYICDYTLTNIQGVQNQNCESTEIFGAFAYIVKI